ncbi:MAG: hypothetical protein ABW098_06385 [Candidatus Thiodiazotropha sp.]
MGTNLEQWKDVANLLKKAHGLLDISNSSVDVINDSEFMEYLENNEHEHALNEIEAIAESFVVPKAFWQCLLKAANRMQLKAHSKRYVKIVGYY